jgi:hypothetical protein
MDQPLPSLDSLGLKHGTDKASNYHNYLAFYERFFERFRHKPAKVLEIGVAGGASVKVWEEYFSQATIIGVDISYSALQFARPRVVIELLDQSNVEELVRLGTKHGPFDIIIEDGSHFWEHQITTLKTLFPFVKNNGVYITEDLHFNYGPQNQRYRGVSSTTCMEYLKKLVDLRVADISIDIDQEEDPFLRTYGRAVQFIAFFGRACVIEKSIEQIIRDAPVDRPFVAVELGRGVLPVSLLAHVGGIGDTRGEAGWIRCRGEFRKRNIQGFAIEDPNQPKLDITYRSRHTNLAWTDWVACGTYVGSRGRADDVTGFSVRLGDKAAEKFELEVMGIFRDEANVVVARGGEDCVARSGNGALWGMQVIVRPKREGGRTP